jgi:hypothetical protein
MSSQPESSTQEVLAGLVERVTYHNADNGFCVLRAKARGHRDLVTVVGHAATIAATEWITASGEWMNDVPTASNSRPGSCVRRRRARSTESRNISHPARSAVSVRSTPRSWCGSSHSPKGFKQNRPAPHCPTNVDEACPPWVFVPDARQRRQLPGGRGQDSEPVDYGNPFPLSAIRLTANSCSIPQRAHRERRLSERCRESRSLILVMRNLFWS